jgi:hypothetical protein
VEELRKTLAEQLLKKFQDGELSLDDAEVGIDNKSLREAAEQDLAHLREKFGDDAFDVLSAMHPKWKSERIRLICNGFASPPISEIRQHMAAVFHADDMGLYLIMVGKFPLKQKEKTIGWAVIRENGIALDRDYEIAFICNTQASASKFISNKFRHSDKDPM